MSASSSSYSTTSSSSSSSVCEMPSGEEQLYQASRMEVLESLCADVTPQPEPAHVCVPIRYSNNFKYIMGIYRTLRAEVEAGCLASASSPGAAARWLLVLAFAMRVCSSHYTAWKDRRDVVLSSSVIAMATRDQLPRVSVVSSDNGTEKPPGTSTEQWLKDMLEGASKKQKILDETAANWLPGKSDIFHVNSDGSSRGGEGVGDVNVWRAVHWEISTVRCFSRNYHKNFQVWHHRKELLHSALATIPLADKPHVMATVENFDAYLQAQGTGLSLVDMDERTVCEGVLLERDAKNYHVWLHRSWFLHAFSFLVAPPSWEALAERYTLLSAPSASLPLNEASVLFKINANWMEEEHCLAATLPPSPLTEELRFTAKIIKEDPWNNSAWCHRLLLLRQDLLVYLLNSPQARLENDKESISPQFEHIIVSICREELQYTLQWVALEPCNEAALVHARTVAALCQSTLLRYALYHALSDADSGGKGRDTSQEDEEESSKETLLTSELVSPVAAARKGSYVDDSTDYHIVRSPLLYVLHQGGISRRLSWSKYAQTFALSCQLQCCLEGDIAPVVRAREQEVFDALATEADSETPPREPFLTGAQMILDNFHQVAATQYHLCFAFLEQTWTLFLSDEAKEAMTQVRSAEMYTMAGGIARDQCIAVSSESSDLGTLQVEEAFFQNELRALRLAKQLVYEDEIRIKYWKHEIMILLQRDY